MIPRWTVALGIAGLLAACGNTRRDREAAFTLPPGLAEISGLAVAGPDSVFAHDDEYAIVYEIALRNGQILRAFALGKPTIEGDFEGIATADDSVFLITSDGLIYSAHPGRNGERMPYHVFDSGVGAHCEIEGLARAPVADSLLILCKRLHNQEKPTSLDIYRWRIGQDHAEAAPWLSFPLSGVLKKSERAEFQPSAIEWDERRRQLVVVSARNHMMMTFDGEGRFLRLDRLNAKHHPKTEGLTIMPDGRYVLADEGSKARDGRIASYIMP